MKLHIGIDGIYSIVIKDGDTNISTNNIKNIEAWFVPSEDCDDYAITTAKIDDMYSNSCFSAWCMNLKRSSSEGECVIENNNLTVYFRSDKQKVIGSYKLILTTTLTINGQDRVYVLNCCDVDLVDPSDSTAPDTSVTTNVTVYLSNSKLYGASLNLSDKITVPNASINNITDLISLMSSNYIKDTSGFKLYESNGKSYLEVDNLDVRLKSISHDLNIRGYNDVAGNTIVSNCSSTISKVEQVTENNVVTGYKCYLLTDNGTVAINNNWVVGMQAICGTFNISTSKYNKTNKYYWRKVSYVSVDGSYIILSNKTGECSLKDSSYYNSVPDANDKICLFGVTDSTLSSYSNAIVILSNGELNGIESPAIIEYGNIIGFDLTSKTKNIWSADKNTVVADNFYINSSTGLVQIPIERGEYVLNTAYSYYDRVSYNGKVWLCIAKAGAPSNIKPGYDDSIWLLQVNSGIGITNIAQYYKVSANSTGITVSDTDWVSDGTIPSFTKTLKYLWNYQKTTFTDGTTKDTTPIIISGYDANVTNRYKLYNVTNNSSSYEGPGWSTTPYKLSSTDKFLWVRDVTLYSDKSTEYGTPYIIGVYGDSGANGSNGTSGKDGADSFSIFMSPSSIVLNADSNNKINGELYTDLTTVTSTISCYKASTAVAFTATIKSTSNCNASVTNGVVSITQIASTTTDSTISLAKYGNVIVTVTPTGGTAQDMVLTWAISVETIINNGTGGQDGQDGYNIIFNPASLLLTADKDNKINGELYNNLTTVKSTIICTKGASGVLFTASIKSVTGCTATLSNGTISITSITGYNLPADEYGNTIFRLTDMGKVVVTVTPAGSLSQDLTLTWAVNQEGYIIRKVIGDFEGIYSFNKVIDGTTIKDFQGALEHSASAVTSTLTEKISAIQVGGRNFVKGSGSPFSYDSTVNYKKYYTATALNDFAGKEVTLGFDYSYSNISTGSTPITSRIGIEFSGKDSSSNDVYFGSWINLTNSSTGLSGSGRKIAVISIPEGTTFTDNSITVWGEVESGGYISVSKIKLETGNKATDWTLAIEDVQADYTSKISQTATSIATEITDRTNADSTLQSSITETSNRITAAVGRIDGTEASISKIQQDNDKISLTVYEGSVSNINKLYQTDFNGKYLTDLNKWVLPNTGYASIVENAYLDRAALQLVVNSVALTGTLSQSLNYSLLAKTTTYTLSFYSKINGTLELIIKNATESGGTYIVDGGAGVASTSKDITTAFSATDTTFTRHTITFTTLNESSVSTIITDPTKLTVSFRCSNGTDAQLCMMQLQTGSTATSWTVCAEDFENSVGTKLEATGIDIKHKEIVVNAANFYINNKDNGPLFIAYKNNVGINGYLRTGVESLNYPISSTVTDRYFVEGKMNLIVSLSNLTSSVDRRIYLPNDYEYIGSKIMIISSPAFADTGEFKDDSILKYVEVRTGRNYMNHTYMLGEGTSADPYYVSNDTLQNDNTNHNNVLPVQSSYFSSTNWFIGEKSTTNLAPNVIKLKNGYVELLGVPDIVSRPIFPYTCQLDEYTKGHSKDSDNNYIYTATDAGKDSVYNLSSAIMSAYNVTEDTGVYYNDLKTGTKTSASIRKAPLCHWVIVGAQASEIEYIKE